MSAIWARVKHRPEGLTVGPNARPAAAVVDALEGGKSWAEVASQFELEPIDLIAAVAAETLGDENSFGPELVQCAASRPGLRTALSEQGLRTLAPNASRVDRLVLAAGLLQLADFWDPSHDAAQSAEDLGERAFSAYWHGIAHRREPDPGNAAYWFRRVGRHALFPALAEAAHPLIVRHTAANKVARTTLGQGSGWDAMEFINFCTQARPASADEGLARRLQRLEMLMLLDLTVATALGG